MRIASKGLVIATVVAAALGFGPGAVHAQTGTGPISAAAAKAAGARTIRASSCVATCKARANVPASDCASKWCVVGKCYQSSKEAYCVK